MREVVNDRLIDIWLAEHARANDEAARLLGQNEKVVEFSLAVIGGLGYLALKDRSASLLCFVPGALSGLFLYTANVHEFAMIARGHAAALETLVNRKLARNVLVWESRVAANMTQFRLTTVTLLSFGIAVQILVAGLVLAYAADHARGWVVAACAIGWGVPFVVAVAKLCQLGRLQRETAERAIGEYAAPLAVPADEIGPTMVSTAA